MIEFSLTRLVLGVFLTVLGFSAGYYFSYMIEKRGTRK